MSQKMFRENCQKCGTVFLTPISEIPLHVVEPGIVLCWKCCKEEFWYEKERCDRCSEKTMCRGLFSKNIRKMLERTEGV